MLDRNDEITFMDAFEHMALLYFVNERDSRKTLRDVDDHYFLGMLPAKLMTELAIAIRNTNQYLDQSTSNSRMLSKAYSEMKNWYKKYAKGLMRSRFGPTEAVDAIRELKDDLNQWQMEEIARDRRDGLLEARTTESETLSKRYTNDLLEWMEEVFYIYVKNERTARNPKMLRHPFVEKILKKELPNEYAWFAMGVVNVAQGLFIGREDIAYRELEDLINTSLEDKRTNWWQEVQDMMDAAIADVIGVPY